MSVTREQLHTLTREIPYKTRTGHKWAKLAYIDARDAMDLLDETVGPENWQCDYKQVKNVVYCGIGINTQDAGWVWKWDAGDESNIEEEKGEASDSFKRAAVRWGIGRFLYRLGANPKPAAVPAQPQQSYTPALASDNEKNEISAKAQQIGMTREAFQVLLKNRQIKWSAMTVNQGRELRSHLGTLAREMEREQNLARSAEFEASRGGAA